MITPREEFGDEYIDELIAERGDEPRLCVTYEEWYFGEPEEDPPYPNEWKTELFFVDEKEDMRSMWKHASFWLVPGSTEAVLAECEEW